MGESSTMCLVFPFLHTHVEDSVTSLELRYEVVEVSPGAFEPFADAVIVLVCRSSFAGGLPTFFPSSHRRCLTSVELRFLFLLHIA